MTDKKQVTFLNYLLPLVMIAVGFRHYMKHGADLWALIPIALGVFSLYLALFNHRLLIRLLDCLTKWWFPIGQFITIILLTVIFYIVFAPVGLILRLFKKDILDKDFKTGRLSYWVDRDTKQQNNYTRQF
jgi:hypothetical protein